MSWPNGEVRKVKLTIMKPASNDNNLIVVFEIDGSQSDEFYDMLIEYFAFIEKNEGMIHKVEETLDSLTSIPCALSVAIAGLNQQAFAQELHAKAMAHNFTRSQP